LERGRNFESGLAPPLAAHSPSVKIVIRRPRLIKTTMGVAVCEKIAKMVEVSILTSTPDPLSNQ